MGRLNGLLLFLALLLILYYTLPVLAGNATTSFFSIKVGDFYMAYIIPPIVLLLVWGIWGCVGDFLHEVHPGIPRRPDVCAWCKRGTPANAAAGEDIV